MQNDGLSAEEIAKILADRPSCMPAIEKANEAARAEVRTRTCPRCSMGLEPRPHPDPRLLFVGTQMRFIGACPGCAFTEGKS